MHYIDQSASGLRYFLVGADVNVEPFQIIDRISLDWFDHQLELGILGASHFLKIKFAGGQTLSEVFACADINLHECYLKSAPFRDLPAQVIVSKDQYEYAFVPRLVTWSDGADELARLRHAIRASAPKSEQWGLAHQFPSLEGDDMSKPPLTLMYIELGSTLTLQTAHCYPNEEQIVFTATTLALKGQK